MRNETPVEVPRRLSILRLVLSIRETTSAYNQFSLAIRQKHDISICTFFRSKLRPPDEISLFDGDDSLRGFLRALNVALAAKEYDVVHAHTPHVAFLFLLARLLGRGKRFPPSVYTVHNSFQSYRKVRTWILLIPAFAFFRRVVCCGDASLESVPRFYRWLAGHRLCAVSNGVDIERIDRAIPADRPAPGSERFTLVAINRLIETKDPVCSVRAFRQAADDTSRLVEIGEGPLREELRTEIEAGGLEGRVELAGLIPRKRVYEVLAEADVFISTSRGEGLPVAVLEAMACRCPVLLSDIAPHREIAADASFIPLVAPGDVEGFAREIVRFQCMSAMERAEVGERCRKLVEERFSLTVMHQRYEAVYAEVLGPGS